jgi:hypothetical protein
MPKRNNRTRNNILRSFTSILKQIDTELTLAPNSTSSGIVDLISNEDSALSNVTVRNFTTNLIAEISGENPTNLMLENVQYYVMFLPEGYNTTVNFPFTHPEWILNYSYQGTPNLDTQSLGFNIRRTSKKSRKLRPGDKIILFMLADNESTNERKITMSGLIKYFSKRN